MPRRFQFRLEDLFLLTLFVATMLSAGPMVSDMLGGLVGGFVGLFQQPR